jgi:phage terminase large subunit-like protein
MTRGERNAAWIEEYCRVPEGKLVGQRVKLTPQQRDWLCQIYDSPTRTFILSMGRKNAKTATSAFILLLHLCGPEAVTNGQLFSAAMSREQAAILFALAAKIVRMSPDLSACVMIRDSGKQLFCPELGTLYRALSAESSTAYGFSPSLVVHDELGQVRGPRSELYEALETAAAAQERPLSIVISTQAPTDADLLSLLIDDAKSGKDPTKKVVLYAADELLDPFSEEAVRQANPHFDVFMNKTEVMRQAEEARRMPSREANYRNLILNQRIDIRNPFVSRSVWERNSAEPEPLEFSERPVFVGLDLSARNDLTALVAVSKTEDGYWDVVCEFFAPALGVEDRAHRDRAPYDVWADQGYLTLTPGSSVDYGVIADRVVQLMSEWQIVSIPFDRWRIDVLKAELSRRDADVPLEPFGQGFKDMSPALDFLEAELLNGRVRHGGNPILRWCVANAIALKDPSGNRKLDKSKSTGRIDGLVALAMAMGAASRQQAGDDAAFSDFIFNPVVV